MSRSRGRASDASTTPARRPRTRSRRRLPRRLRQRSLPRIRPSPPACSCRSSRRCPATSATTCAGTWSRGDSIPPRSTVPLPSRSPVRRIRRTRTLRTTTGRTDRERRPSRPRRRNGARGARALPAVRPLFRQRRSRCRAARRCRGGLRRASRRTGPRRRKARLMSWRFPKGHPCRTRPSRGARGADGGNGRWKGG